MELYYTSAHIIIIYCIYTDFLSFLFFSDIINNSILTINKIISIGFVMFMKTYFTARKLKDIKQIQKKCFHMH